MMGTDCECDLSHEVEQTQLVTLDGPQFVNQAASAICLICFNRQTEFDTKTLALFIDVTFDIVSICENFQLLGNAIKILNNIVL